MSAEDDVYVLAGDEPTLWAYPSQVHPADGQTATATGSGTATITLAVALARDVVGDGISSAGVGHAVTVDAVGSAVLDVGAEYHPPGPPSGGGGNTYPTRLRPWERDEEPEDEPDLEDDDVLALILLGVL